MDATIQLILDKLDDWCEDGCALDSKDVLKVRETLQRALAEGHDERTVFKRACELLIEACDRQLARERH